MLAIVLAIAAPAATADATPLPSSIAALEDSLRTGATTCEAVTSDALAAIADAHHLRAVTRVNPDALSIARALDAERAAGMPQRPLQCLPLLVKGNYETADTLDTTVGSIVMRGFRASKDAFVVQRLREAGAVVLGKTNLDEWAHGVSGYSSDGGQTLNPLRRTRLPGGSSGGSAVGIAAGLALVATGSDTGGSIQIPASWTGTVGLRPTMGLISRGGIVPFASCCDVPGPLTRSVEDLARTLGFWTGVDPADPATEASAGHALDDYTPFLDPDGLRGARIGVVPAVLGQPFAHTNADVDHEMRRALSLMRAQGATVKELPPIEIHGASWHAFAKIPPRQFRPELDAWFDRDGLQAPVHSLREVIAASSEPGIRERVRVLKPLRAEENAPPPSGPVFDHALHSVAHLRSGVIALMAHDHLDALVFAATGCPAPPLPDVEDPTYACHHGGTIAPLLSPATGLPALTIPGGPLPGNQRLGINLLGPPWSEGPLIRLGYAFQQAQAAATMSRSGR
jgi:amidase